VVGVATGEDLRLILQPAKRAGMQHSVAVALEIVAIRVSGFRDAPPAGVLDVNGVAGKHAASLPAATS
jgi:hypothetical protein